MKAVVILRGEAENAHAAAFEALGFEGVGFAEEFVERVVSAFDPDARCVVDSVEDDGAAVCRGGDDLRSVRCAAWPGVRLQRPIEEFVEVLELGSWQEHLRHIELMEGNESRNLGRRGWVVKLPP